jgi:hypothetical protein
MYKISCKVPGKSETAAVMPYEIIRNKTKALHIYSISYELSLNL